MQQVFPGRGPGAANTAEHRAGHTVDKVDQTSSATMLGLAAVGAAAASLLLSVIV